MPPGQASYGQAQKKPPVGVTFKCVISTRHDLLSDHAGGGKVLPGIALFSQGAAPQLSLPLLRFTPEFEMDRGGSTTLWTPG